MNTNAEQIDLALGKLPQLKAPEASWHQVRKTLVKDQRQKRFSRALAVWADYAVAASVVLVFSALLVLVPGKQQVNKWQSYSQQLEEYYRYSKPEGAIPAEQAYMLADMEDRITAVDQLLQEDSDNPELWQYRSELFESLIQINRYDRSLSAVRDMTL